MTARYFKDEWRTPFSIYDLDGKQVYLGMCAFDRVRQKEGDYNPLSIPQQQNPQQSPVATHKLTCHASFDLDSIAFVVCKGKKWIINDFQELDDIFILTLYSKGAYIEKA
jgi:hypothetical protein